MAEPVRERIQASLLAALQQITIANGYTTTFLDVRALPLGPDAPQVQYPAVGLHDVDDVPIGEREGALNFETRELGVVIEFWVAEEAGVALRTTRNRAFADIYRALLVDPYRGGDALDTVLGPAVAINDSEITRSHVPALAGMEVRYTCGYRTSLGDATAP